MYCSGWKECGSNCCVPCQRICPVAGPAGPMPLAPPDPQEHQEPLAPPDPQEHQEPPDPPDPRERREPSVPPALREPQGLPVPPGPQEHQGLPVPPALPERREAWEQIRIICMSGRTRLQTETEVRQNRFRPLIKRWRQHRPAGIYRSCGEYIRSHSRWPSVYLV